MRIPLLRVLLPSIFVVSLSSCDEQSGVSLTEKIKETLDHLSGHEEKEKARLAEVSRKRGEWIGEKFDRIEFANGKSYEKATITGIADSGVVVRHSHGVARIGYNDLTPQQRTDFAIDGKSAVRAKQSEKKSEAGYHAEIERTASIRAAERETAAARAERDAMAMKARLAEVNAKIKVESSQRALAQPPRVVGNGGVYRYGYRSARHYDVHYHNHNAPDPRDSTPDVRRVTSRRDFSEDR